jgi:two-component system response regulator PilR (NtrC family)
MAGEKILIVDDEKNMCQYLSIMLRKEGYDVKTVHNGKKALQEIKESTFDVVITDIKMEGMDGIELLSAVKESNPTLPVVIMTAYASTKTAIDALNRGAFYYLIKRAKNDEIKMVIRNALDMHRVKNENVFLKKQLKKRDDFKEIIGKSEEIQKVFSLVNKVADTDSTILISGESGTGKELIARAIHYRSARANNPFVSINCGALPENLLESELFGHVKGSFTGAIRDKDGMFKVASGGTFFLDEVGETSLAIQVKLLRVLQEREIIPVGGTAPIKVDVRLIAATNADLEKAMKEERFRADLYYRLNVIPILIPPLRERRDDIPLLVDDLEGSDGAPHELRLAGERPRAREHRRAGLHPPGWRGHRRGRSSREGAPPFAGALQGGHAGDADDARRTRKGVPRLGPRGDELAEETGERDPRHQRLDPLSKDPAVRARAGEAQGPLKRPVLQ